MRVTLVGQDDVGDRCGDGLLGRLRVVRRREQLFELVAGAVGEAGEGLEEQVVHPGDEIGHGSRGTSANPEGQVEQEDWSGAGHVDGAVGRTKHVGDRR
jgi:hypothetical protein